VRKAVGLALVAGCLAAGCGSHAAATPNLASCQSISFPPPVGPPRVVLVRSTLACPQVRKLLVAVFAVPFKGGGLRNIRRRNVEGWQCTERIELARGATFICTRGPDIVQVRNPPIRVTGQGP
jgi:hypothetical protein